MLSFQRLDVYQRAIEFLVLTTELTESLPRGHAGRADQLIRAAESVVRNIAEGAGRWSEADSAKHYKIARGEAMECAASLDVLRLRKLVAADRTTEASGSWRALSRCLPRWSEPGNADVHAAVAVKVHVNVNVSSC